METTFLMIIGVVFLLFSASHFLFTIDERGNLLFKILYVSVAVLVVFVGVISESINKRIEDTQTYQKVIISQQLKTTPNSLNDIMDVTNESLNLEDLSCEYTIVDITDTIKELSIYLQGDKFKIFKVSDKKTYIVDLENKIISNK